MEVDKVEELSRYIQTDDRLVRVIIVKAADLLLCRPICKICPLSVRILELQGDGGL